MSEVGKVQIDKPKLILGEGKEELRIFKKIVDMFGVPKIQVMEYGGIDKLSGYLRALGNSSGFREQPVTTVGITRDADKSRESALNAINRAINSARRNLCDARIVPFIICPLGKDAGMLEDIFLQSIEGGKELGCVDQLFECIKKVQGPMSNNPSKSRIQAYLATRHTPGLRLGESVEKEVWELDHPAFASLVEFIKSL